MGEKLELGRGSKKKLQIILVADLDFEKTVKKIRTSRLVKWCGESGKGNVGFILKKFPNDIIQVSSKGIINLYTTDLSVLFERFIEYISQLSRVIRRKDKEGKERPAILWDVKYNFYGIEFRDLAEIVKKIAGTKHL